VGTVTGSPSGRPSQGSGLSILTEPHRELPAAYSITSSARASSAAGMSSPRLRRHQIHDEVKFGRLLNRYVGWLHPTENLVDHVGGAPEQVREVWSIGHHTSDLDVLAASVHCRQSRCQRPGIDSNSVSVHERRCRHVKSFHATFERLKLWRDVLRPPDSRCDHFEAERAGGGPNLAHLRRVNGIANIGHDGQLAQTRQRLAQKLKPLAAKIAL